MLMPDGVRKVRNSQGYVWTRKSNGEWLLPSDLGYLEIVGWSMVQFCERWLLNQGKPISFSNEQLRQILWFSAVDPVTLDFVFPVTAITRIKSAGKDFLAACFCLFEFLGACRPYRDPRIGEVRTTAQPNAWVTVLATSLEQTANTSLYFRSMLSEDAIKHFGVDLGKELSYSAAGGRLECVTSNPIRLEGGRPTAISCTEIGLWTPSNQGPDLWAAVERGAAKIPNTRVFASSNAHAEGAGSVLEMLVRDYEAQETGRMSSDALRINLDSLSAPADTDLSDPDSIRYGIQQALGDAIAWVDLDRVLAVALSTRTRIEFTKRFSLNLPASPDEALYDSTTVDRCIDGSLSLSPGDEIALGLDVSLSDDASALIAVRISDGAAFPLRIVERPLRADPDWKVDVGIFDHAIAQAFRTYTVRAWFSDVNPIQGHVIRWEQEYGGQLAVGFDREHTVAADMRTSLRRFTAGHELLVARIENADLPIASDLTLRRHILNAHRRPNRFGLSFGKKTRDSHDKVDAYAALLLACMARDSYLAGSPQEPAKKKRSNFVRW